MFMRIKLPGLLLLLCFCTAGYAQFPQLVNAGNDTTLCAGTVILDATVQDVYSTANYTVASVNYSPEPFNQGTLIPFGGDGDDQVSGPLNIGFTFCFFGQAYTQFYVGTNGWVGFSPGQPQVYFPTSIPNTSPNVPKNVIMGPYMDWHMGLNGAVRYSLVGAAPFRKLVVSWDDAGMYSCGSPFGTFQVVLYETTNIIENHIEYKGICPSWLGGTAVQGIHNSNGTQAVVFPGRNNTQWSVVDTSVRYTPAGPALPRTITWTDIAGNTVGTGDSITTPFNGTQSYIATVNYTGCTNITLRDTMTASFGLPVYSITPKNVTCFGANNGTVSVAAAGGPYSFTWSTGDTTSFIDSLVPGSYTVTITSGLCSFTDSVRITTPPLLQATSLSEADTCDRSRGTIRVFASGGTGDLTYAWSPAVSSDSIATGLVAGNYTISITDTNSCQLTHTVTVAGIPGPTAFFNISDPAPGVNEPVTFTDASSPNGDVIASWQWDIGGTSYNVQNPPPHAFTQRGTYTVTLTVTDSKGCSSTYSMVVEASNELLIPNVFTPNGDGVNDVFRIRYLSQFPGSSVTVFNRWGNKVFESPDYKNDWIPTEDEAPDGTYYFILVLPDGKQVTSFVTILRGQ